MKRYDCLQVLAKHVKDEDLVVNSLGGLVDEWYNLRPYGSLTLEILGSITPVAFGLAVALPHRRIVCIDTDGSLFMNTGVMCTLGNQRPKNLVVYVLDNECYECIGGPPTPSAGNVDITKMAQGAGIDSAVEVRNIDEFTVATEEAFTNEGLSFIVCKIKPGTVTFPPEKRMPTDGFEDMYNFVRYIEKLEGIVIKPPAEHN